MYILILLYVLLLSIIVPLMFPSLLHVPITQSKVNVAVWTAYMRPMNARP